MLLRVGAHIRILTHTHTRVAAQLAPLLKLYAVSGRGRKGGRAGGLSVCVRPDRGSLSDGNSGEPVHRHAFDSTGAYSIETHRIVFFFLAVPNKTPQKRSFPN